MRIPANFLSTVIHMEIYNLKIFFWRFMSKEKQILHLLLVDNNIFLDSYIFEF